MRFQWFVCDCTFCQFCCCSPCHRQVKKLLVHVEAFHRGQLLLSCLFYPLDLYLSILYSFLPHITKHWCVVPNLHFRSPSRGLSKRHCSSLIYFKTHFFQIKGLNLTQNVSFAHETLHFWD